jgi:hypothetical protein
MTPEEKEGFLAVAWARISNVSDEVTGVFLRGEDIELRSERLVPLYMNLRDLRRREGQDIGHGHVWPRADGVLARCGGPAMCKQCALELAHKTLFATTPERFK